MQKKTYLVFSLVMLAVLVITQAGLAAPQAQTTGEAPTPDVRWNLNFDAIASLRNQPQLDPAWPSNLPRDRKWLPNRQDAAPGSGSELVQGEVPSPSVGTLLNSFEGINNVNGVLPPDTNGDIGPNHYVQVVNLSFAVYDRQGNTLYGPNNVNSIWAGFGGYCESTNDGDPIVLYDRLADRWFISQFALPRFPIGPFYQCIAVSQTPDPTAGWYRYAFQYSKTKMNDYPHFGVWPNGYYMSANQFQYSAGSLGWAGQGVVVYERDKMLLGQAARSIQFDLFGTDPNLGGMLPAHFEGTPPPAGEDPVFAEIDDDAWGYSPDQLQLWKFHTDWVTTSNSSFTKIGTLPVAAFDTDMCAGSRNCIPQPGGTNVDSLSDRLMYRLQYRNFGSYKTLVVNHTVDVNGADHAGLRWYELRNTGGAGWTVYQQGTYAPDAAHRWVGSAAMNGQGEIALGYSVSSTSVYPSLRYTGRAPGDPLGTMSAEGTIIAGTGFQDHSAGRWGDYSSTSVDPTDDCTFWFTSEYFTSQVAGNASWQTRIGSFQLSACGTPVDQPPSVTITNPADGASVVGTINVTANASDDHGVTQVAFFIDGNLLSTDGSAPYQASWNSTTVADGPHQVKAVATDTIGQTGEDINTANVANNVSTVMHVGDLDGSGVNSSNPNRWNATVTIYVHDANHAAVTGALVTGAWSNGSSGTSTCTTDSVGKCSVTKTNLARRTVTSVTFTVNNVTKTGFTFNSGANHDPDGDSNGTAIVVNRP